MMVDVDDERCGVDEPRLADPALLRAVHGDEHALCDVRGCLAQEPPFAELQKRILAGERLRAAEHHHRVLAELDEREVRGEQRPQRVAVGVVMGRHDEPLPGRSVSTTASMSLGGIVVSVGGGASSSISWVMRTPCSTARS